MGNRALIVGIDDYGPVDSLNGCKKDATSVAEVLEANGDGSPNFDCKLLLSSSRKQNVTASSLLSATEALFDKECDVALFYFAGHGAFTDTLDQGYLVTQDGSHPNWGIPLADIVSLANRSHPKVKAAVILLDSCHSGAAGDDAASKAGSIATIGTGTTILAACRKDEGAVDDDGNGHGLFTGLLIDAIKGGASDVLGRITPASIYAYIDQTLGEWSQRPVYKANVDRFVNLRSVPPKVPLETMRRLPKYFTSPSSTFPLDPSFEEDRSGVADRKGLPPPDPENVRTFKELQLCNRQGLVVPDGAEHMYYAAIDSKGCRLTTTGAHYWRLACQGRI